MLHRPKSQQRWRQARFSRYDPCAKEKREVAAEAAEQLGGIFAEHEPVRVDMTFTYKIPKSWNKKKKEAKHIDPDCTSGADIDNLIKFYLDSLNGVLYKDDSQVTRISAVKLYGEEDRVTIIAYF